MAWIAMILVASAETIIACCGSQMLATMWLQLSILMNCEIYPDETGICAEMSASLQAELDACLDCQNWIDG